MIPPPSQTSPKSAEPVLQTTFRMKKTPSPRKSPNRITKSTGLRLTKSKLITSSLVTGRIPTPKSSKFGPQTPLTTQKLMQTIAAYRKTNPESCGLAPPAQWANCLSPSFLSPTVFPVKQIAVSTAIVISSSEEDSDDDHYWDEGNDSDIMVDSDDDGYQAQEQGCDIFIEEKEGNNEKKKNTVVVEMKDGN